MLRQLAWQLRDAQAGEPVEDWFAAAVRLPLPDDRASAERVHEANLLRAGALLRAHLPVLASLGALSPFIGLFGTVIGIMHSFHAISEKRGAGIEIVGSGISEALTCTAAGLAVAVLAVLAYNIFSTQVRRFLDALDIEYLDGAAGEDEGE
ncbi:MAG: MotA/TolQ/ExbB proton channel family protein [Armatimonadetes bacterium]|nr:MotA/TolQ/ExbB proton channel family protein [Armatimonadota bacterium]